MPEPSLDSDKEELYFQTLKRWITKNLSFDPSQYNDSYLRRRIQSRLYSNQIKSFGEYIYILKTREKEKTLLLSNLTVNVTRFFRNAPLYEEIEKTILPAILRSPKKKITIWSAGCASGEEPYSLAMLLVEMSSIRPLNQISLIATDIDADALAKAKAGEYSLSQLTETRADIITKYFAIKGETYYISESIKNIITFKQHDLFHDVLLKDVDLILCRNVVIYFTPEAKEKLYVDFYNSLDNMGYLIMGKSETLSGEARKKFFFVNSDEKIYQKRLVP